MSEQQVSEAHALFERALAEPPERRAAFLDRVCAGRTDLRERLDRLLHLAGASDGFLDRAAIRPRSAGTCGESAWVAGQRIGDYRLLRPLGRGGMAEVWLAERSAGGFHQQAAVKLIAHAGGVPGRRFAAERDILAALAHPSIARLHDGGVEADGSAYMVMEYVEGEHLTAWADTRALPLGDRLELFLQICDAVAYAHTRLVVHRDLKPANVLVTAEGHAMLLDFGIAKLLGADDAADATRTLYLSPTYAAPEQLTGDAIGTATDVYSLGVIAFELLTGRRPWQGDASPMAAVVQRLLDRPMPMPSRVVDAGSPVPARALRGDLDAIVGKALRREPDQRYADARALADDVRRHLAHRPVLARSGARAYVARRFLRRNWLPLSTAALLFVAMAIATAVVVRQENTAHLAARRAEREARTATAVQAFLREVFRANSSAQSDPVKARQTTARELLDLGAKKIGTAMDDAPEAKLDVLQLLGDLYEDLWMPDERSRVLRQAADLARKSYRPEAPELAAVLIAHAEATYEAGAETASESILREAQEILDRGHEPDSALRGRLLIAQANIHRYTNLPFALDCARRAVSVFEKLPPSVDSGNAWHQLGLRQRDHGEFRESIVSQGRAIELYGAIPEGRIFLDTAYKNLAHLQLYVGDFSGAERSSRLDWAATLATRGENSVQAIDSRVILGELRFARGRVDESLDAFAAAKRQAQALPPSETTYRHWALQESGKAQARAGDLEAGLADLQAALAIRRSQMSDDILVAVTLEQIAATLIDMGRLREARDALGEAATIRGATGQARSLNEAVGLVSLSRLALAEHRVADARRALDEFVARDDPTQRITSLTIARWLLEAEINEQSGDFGAATAAVAGARAEILRSGQAEYFGEYSADADALEGGSRLGSGDAAGALPLLRRSLALRETMLLPKSPKIAEAQVALAECQLALGRAGQARELAAKAQAIHAQHEELGERYREPLRRLLRDLPPPRPRTGTRRSAESDWREA